MKYYVFGIVSSIFTAHLALASVVTPVFKHCMRAEVWNEEDWPNEPFDQFLARCVDYQENLQPFKKARSTWGIIDRCAENFDLEKSFVLNNDQTTWQNLQLFIPTHEEAPYSYLLHHINRTKLALGRRILETWVAYPQPKSKIDIVKQRQEVVQYLLRNEKLFSSLEEQLSKIKEGENSLLSFWLNDPLYNSISKSYFKSLGENLNQKVNSFPPILGVSAWWSHSQRMFQSASAVLGLATLTTFSLAPTFLKESYAATYLGAASPVFAVMRNCLNGDGSSQSYFWRPFYACAAVLTAAVVKESYCWARDNVSLQKYCQEKLIRLSSSIRAIHQINELLTESQIPVFAQFTKALQELSNGECEGKQLLGLLQSNTFQDTPSLLSSSGNILTAYRLMHEHKDLFENVLYILGEIDAYMSIVRLYKEYEHKPVHYSFVSFAESDSPIISVQELWNPFLDSEKVVPNTIAMGGAFAKRNMVLTGPNEGGKSTFVKGTALSIILAQSIGLVPAKQAYMTPFDYVATYLNITDDDGKSLFEAQAARAKSILDHIEGLERDQFVFVILDEMFNGTNATVGQSLAYTYANYLGNYPNVMAVFPTHFPFLTTLDANDSYSNYCLGAIPNADGTIAYTYKIVPGIWERNIALDILRHEGFSDTFINDANRLLK